MFYYNNTYLFSPIGSPVAKYKFDSVKNDFSLFSKEGFAGNLGSSRMEIWKMTINLIAQTPIIGCGTDNLERGLATYCTDDFIQYAIKHQCVIDKAHNEFLHIAATNGIPALIVYLVFLCLILVTKFINMFKDKKALVFSLCITSYLAQAFFNISTLGVAPLFRMILGLCDNQFIEKDVKYE